MKKFTKVLVFLAMVICLSGCMKVNLEMNVKSSNEMTLKMDYLVEEKLLTMSGMTRESFIEEMKSGMGEAASLAEITSKSETINGEKWEGVTVSAPIKETELKKMLTEKEIDGEKRVVLTLSKEFMSSDQFGGMDMDADKIAQQTGYSIDKLKALGLEMNLVINMPAKATTNIGKADDKKVTIDLLELVSNSTVQNIEISSPLKDGVNLTTYILIGVGAVALIGIVALILKTKKNKKNTETISLDESIEPQSSEQETDGEIVEETTTEVTNETSEDSTKKDITDNTEETK